MFDFNVSLDDEDYLEYWTYHAIQSKSGIRAMFLSFAAAPVAGLLIATSDYIISLDLEIILIDGVLIAIIGLLWLLFHQKILVWMNR